MEEREYKVSGNAIKYDDEKGNQKLTVVGNGQEVDVPDQNDYRKKGYEIDSNKMYKADEEPPVVDRDGKPVKPEEKER